MSLTGFSYLLFVAGALVAARFLERNSVAYKLLLTVISYYFYATYDIRFCALLLAVTFANFVAGRAVEACRHRSGKKWTLAVIILFDIGVLFAFKYFDFFVEALEPFIGEGLLKTGLTTLLPIGISFFIFQALTYPLDIYRGDVHATRSFLDFSFFLSFFPQLLSGPIVRASFFLPQLAEQKPRGEQFALSGIPLVFQGLIKKVALADVLAAHIVNPAFANPDAYSPVFLAIGLVAYSFQIYLDLSGYTDMARGVSRFFGYELPINFDRPYLAKSVSNYWQRWHISMSSFFRDYLYFGLGGSRHGNVYFNLLITFVAIGLWHGAGWNFILYGMLHGSMVGFERWRRKRRERLGLPAAKQLASSALLAITLTFAFVTVTRVLFRSGSLEATVSYMSAMGRLESWDNIPLTPLGMVALLAGILLHCAPRHWPDRLSAFLLRLPAPATAAIFSVLILGLTSVADGGTAFIYFQF